MEDAICNVEDAQSTIHPAQNAADDAICTVEDAQSILDLTFCGVDGDICILHRVLSSIVLVFHYLHPTPTLSTLTSPGCKQPTSELIPTALPVADHWRSIFTHPRKA